jgi:hypothetical protein
MSRDNPVYRSLVIRREKFAEGGYSELLVKIDDNGDLVLDAADAGESVRSIVGDWDYEYSETVPAQWKDTMLLHLIKERFTSTSEFGQWCKARNVSASFWSWA